MALTKSERSLFDAVEKGDLKQVKTLLKKVKDLDFEGDYGRTPLEQAIFGGHMNVVKALVDAGADINRINDYDQTPLDYARAYSETKIATYLKGEGALKKGEAAKRSSYSAYDDDYFGSGSFYDEEDDWHGTSRTGGKKARAPAKKTASRAASGRFGASSADPDGNDSEGGGNARPEKANQPVKPKFSEETLKDVFNAKSWIGKTEEMQKLWDEVPVKLQKKYDFDTALAEAKRETLRQNAPLPPKLQLNAPVNTPPDKPQQPPPAQ